MCQGTIDADGPPIRCCLKYTDDSIFKDRAIFLFRAAKLLVGLDQLCGASCHNLLQAFAVSLKLLLSCLHLIKHVVEGRNEKT